MAEKALEELQTENEALKARLAIQLEYIRRQNLLIDALRGMLKTMDDLLIKTDEINQRDFGGKLL